MCEQCSVVCKSSQKHVGYAGGCADVHCHNLVVDHEHHVAPQGSSTSRRHAELEELADWALDVLPMEADGGDRARAPCSVACVGEVASIVLVFLLRLRTAYPRRQFRRICRFPMTNGRGVTRVGSEIGSRAGVRDACEQTSCHGTQCTMRSEAH